MRRGSVPVWAILLPLILLELGTFFVLLRNSSWVYDDNFFLIRAGQEGFVGSLTAVHFEHWDIGVNAAISLQHLLFFFDYRWALIAMLLVLGGSIFVFERTLAMIVTQRWIVLVFAAWFGLSILWVRPLQWWSAGVQYFPYTFFDLLCLYGFLRYHAGGSARWIAVSVAGLAAALLFYEKPAYMLVYLLLLRVLLMSEDLHPKAVLETLWRERMVWTAYLAVILIWGAAYIHSHAYTSHGGVHLGQYLTYFRILWLQTLVPSLAGVTIPASHLDGLQILFVVIAQVVVVACVVISLRRRRSAWRAWAFLAIILILSGGLVARSRVAIFGVGIANDPRYLIDYAWLVPLTLCAAFSGSDVLKPIAPDGSSRISLPAVRTVAPILALLLLAYAAGTIAAAAQLERIWGGPGAREWNTRVRRDFAALEHSGQRPVVAENTTPFEIMEEFVAPYNRLSRVLPLYVGPTQVDGPLDGPLVRLDNDGNVHHTMLELQGDGALPDLIRSHQIAFGPGGRELREGTDTCVIADGTPVSITRTLPAAVAAQHGPYYVRLMYRAWQQVALPVTVSEAPAETDGGIVITPGAGASIAWVGPNRPSAVTIDIPPVTTVCLSRLDVASLQDTD